MRGIYVHIPFCQNKCGYCDFFSVCAPEKNIVEEYCSRLKASFSGGRNRPADTVYFGGGTPTAIAPDLLCSVLDAVRCNFSLAPDSEISLEANPNTVSKQSLLLYKQAGFNRISFGAQSFSDEELRALGRTHNAQQIREAVKWAKEAGFENISLDLMLAIPEQTEKSLEYSLAQAVSLEVQHLSVYILKVEEKTPFGRSGVTVDDDLAADLYLQAVKYLERAGFSQYEISNFAKPGFACRHNLKYWNCDEYFGFGAAAHSFVERVRFANTDRLDFSKDSARTSGGGFEEYAMLRLRLTDGLLTDEFARRGGDTEKILEKAHRFVPEGFVKVESGRIALTPKGLLISNTIIGALLL